MLCWSAFHQGITCASGPEQLEEHPEHMSVEDGDSGTVSARENNRRIQLIVS
jgi:hypothetical protein